jgi:hypothetical protein
MVPEALGDSVSTTGRQTLIVPPQAYVDLDKHLVKVWVTSTVTMSTMLEDSLISESVILNVGSSKDEDDSLQ